MSCGFPLHAELCHCTQLKLYPRLTITPSWIHQDPILTHQDPIPDSPRLHPGLASFSSAHIGSLSSKSQLITNTNAVQWQQKVHIHTHTHIQKTNKAPYLTRAAPSCKGWLKAAQTNAKPCQEKEVVGWGGGETANTNTKAVQK